MEGNANLSGEEKKQTLRNHNLFREAIDVFKTLNIPWWLDQGTLLGVIREGGLLSTDHDLDLGMWMKDYKKVRREIVCRFRQKGVFIETYKPHQLSITDLYGRLNMINIAFYRHERGRAIKKVYYPVSGRVAEWLIRVVRLCAHAGAGTLEKKLPLGRKEALLLAVTKIIPVPLWNFLCYSAGKSHYYFRPFFWMAVHEDFYLNLETVSVEDLILPVPGNPEAYLEFKYGPEWQIPRKDWVYWKDDGAIIP